jgi:hypothetical protein
MERIGTYDDFVGMTDILLEFVRAQYHVYQNSMCFVEIDDEHSVFREGNRRVRQNILDCRNHVSDRLDLDRFYCQNIVGFVHLYWNMKISTSIFIFYFELIV